MRKLKDFDGFMKRALFSIINYIELMPVWLSARATYSTSICILPTHTNMKRYEVFEVLLKKGNGIEEKYFGKRYHHMRGRYYHSKRA